MAIKDYWVYQKRDVPTPWALYIVKEYDKRKPDATSLDYTFYHEDINNPTHSVSFVNVKYDSIDGYVNHIITNIVEVTNVDNQDLEQLRESIEDILLH